MKLLVAVKRVVDYNVKIRINTEHTAVDTRNVKMAMNPFCEIALEEAVRLKESLGASVTVVTVGTEAAQETLRQALALGADQAQLVLSEQEPSPLTVAKVLQQIVQREPYDLILLGKQSIDGDNNQTGQMLAALLDRPQGTFASKLTVTENNEVEVTREVDGGLETLLLQLPAVVTADLRLNQPRYASLPNIMKAKQKPIEHLVLEDLLPGRASKRKVLQVEPPAKKQAGIKVASVAELVAKLREEVGLINLVTP